MQYLNDIITSYDNNKIASNNNNEIKSYNNNHKLPNISAIFFNLSIKKYKNISLIQFTKTYCI